MGAPQAGRRLSTRQERLVRFVGGRLSSARAILQTGASCLFCRGGAPDWPAPSDQTGASCPFCRGAPPVRPGDFYRQERLVRFVGGAPQTGRRLSTRQERLVCFVGGAPPVRPGDSTDRKRVVLAVLLLVRARSKPRLICAASLFSGLDRPLFSASLGYSGAYSYCPLVEAPVWSSCL